MKPIKDADINLVELRDDGNIGTLTPHCKIHGAINRLTKDGIWRCVSTYRLSKNSEIRENNYLEGCQYENK